MDKFIDRNLSNEPPSQHLSSESENDSICDEICSTSKRFKGGGRVKGLSTPAPIWQYFTRNVGSKGEKISTCNICSHDFPGHVNTNNVKHLQSNHRKIMMYNEKLRSRKEEVVACTSQAKTQNNKIKSVQLTLEQAVDNRGVLKELKYPAKQEIVEKALAIAFASNSVPHLLIDKPEFKTVFSILDPKFSIPSRATISKKISDVTENIKVKVVTSLKNARKVSVCVDGWTMPGFEHSCIGVSVQFFDMQDEKIKKAMLAVKKLSGSHSGPAVLEAVESVLRNFDVPDSKIIAFITDNGSNMIRAFRENIVFSNVDLLESDDEDELSRNFINFIKSKFSDV